LFCIQFTFTEIQQSMWHKKSSIEQINAFNKNTLMEHLGMECITIGDDFLEIRMPVDNRTHQPMGLLHGGASAALIESIGSMGSAMVCDLTSETPVGLEVNCNHLKGVKSGCVIARGTLAHKGSRTHVWHVDIRDEQTNALVCTGRLTVMILKKD
jgi:1,4-dihydroxy-2-naphthoyl-CoA hydrolase